MAKTITITINDTDEKVLMNDILDANTWVQEAMTGKINNCIVSCRYWTRLFCTIFRSDT